ncbi:uncharacterized protein LOC135817183 [Sycon ciliatum]|uniref:uncharacterized protein LOC135817183 n=1 Tax=Sycon ciliatum TaxID=27933 RepID=UPI0031F71471
MPSIAVSPSKHQVILHGFGPGECANLLLVYEDRKTRVIRTQQQQQGTPLVSEFGSALVTIPIIDPLRGSYSDEMFYLVSYGGCSSKFYSAITRRCTHSSNNLHRLLVRGHVFGEWEYIDFEVKRSKNPESSVFSRLFHDSANSMLLFGGVKRNESTTPLNFGIWRFNLSSLVWIEVINLDISLKYDKDVMVASYKAAKSKFIIYWPRKGTIICCDVLRSLASCAKPVTGKRLMAYTHSQFLNYQISSGPRRVFFVGRTHRIISTIVYKILQQTTKVDQMELSHVYKVSEDFLGFKTGSSAKKVPGILVPSSSVGKMRYVFFGVGTPLPSGPTAMAVWILQNVPGSRTDFVYTLLYPSPAPSIPRRKCHTVTLVGNDTAILYGGRQQVANRFSPTGAVKKTDPNPWCYSLQMHAWKKGNVTASSFPPPRTQHIAFQYNSTTIVVHGGLVSKEFRDLAVRDLWMFVLDDAERCQGRWHNLTAHVKTGKLPKQYGHSVTRAENGVFLYGGEFQSPSILTFLAVHSPSQVVVQPIPISPSIPNRWDHSLSYFSNDLILLGGMHRICGTPTEAEWALLMSVQTNETSTVVTWTKFFDVEILSHTVLRDKIFGGFRITVNDTEQVSILNTTGLCPIGHARDRHNACHPCAIGYYSATLQQECTICKQSLTTTAEAAAYCVSKGPCDRDTCNGHGDCIGDYITFKHLCVCKFGYLPDDDCKTPSIYLALMAAFVFTSTLTILTIALIQFFRKRRALNAKEIELVKTNRDLYRSNRKLSQLDHGTCIAWSDLEIKKQLATGRFSKVILAKLGDITVVVKQLPKFVATASPDDAFIREAEVLRTLRHPNIVMFFGAGRDTRSGCPFLVMEYLRRGSLYDVIHDESKVIEHIDRLRFSLDAARGIKYLHSTSPPRIHRDIKSANMLVSDKWVVKVADMETTRFLAILRANTDPKETSPSAANGEMDRPTRTTSFTSQESDLLTTPLLATTDTVLADDSHGNTQDRHRDTEGMTSRIGMTCGVGTDRWRSPESIKKNLYTEKHDVYSFGVVMWELSTRQIPYGHLHNSDDVLDEIAGGSKLIFPPSIRYAYRHLAEQCIKTDPEERPCMHRVVHELTSQLDSF